MTVTKLKTPVAQLQGLLSRLRLGQMEPKDITRKLTALVEDWARGQGWDVCTEYDIPGYARQDSDVGGRLDVYARCADGTGVAIEIDRFAREKSLDKLAFCAASGDQALWIRWRIGGAPSRLAVPAGVHMMDVDVSARSAFLGWGGPAVVPGREGGGHRAPASRAYAPWSTGELRQLETLHQEGVSISQIARELGRAPGAIRSRLRHLGLEPT